MHELLAAAIEIARGAGRIVADHYGRAREVSHKGTIDLVTTADKAAEAFVLAELARRYPTHAVLSEEAGAQAGGGDVRWVVDPLDGTTNFAHGFPHFAVLVAAQERSDDGYETLAAATYDPMRDELFTVERGGGLRLDDALVSVSQTARLIEAIMATGFAYDRLFGGPDNHAEFCRLNLLTRGVRRAGSAGLDLAYVACGRLDGFWEYSLQPWDLAGGSLMVREAGGVVTALDGAPHRLDSPSMVASNGALHATLLEALHSAQALPIGSREGLERFLPEDVARRLVR